MMRSNTLDRMHRREMGRSALQYFGDPATRETEKFILMFDRFFDCLNVRSNSKQRKPDLLPYTSPNDERLEVKLFL